MSLQRPVDLFYVGPPKTASTWAYACLKQHPQIVTTARDSIGFFDNFYHRGHDWYARQFPAADATQVLFDPTPWYIGSSVAPERILHHNPSAKVIIGIRNPVDRAFSHYWHLRKQGLIEWSFDDVLANPSAYSLFITPGFIADRIKFFSEQLSPRNVHLLLFDDLQNDPKKVFVRLCEFAEIPTDIEPNGVDRKVNAAGAKQTLTRRAMNRAGRALYGPTFERRLESSPLARFLSGKAEYLRGMSDSTRRELIEVYASEIASLEKILGRRLGCWRDA